MRRRLTALATAAALAGGAMDVRAADPADREGTDAAIRRAAAFRPGDFRADQNLRATYRFGWSGITAATGMAKLRREDAGHSLHATVATSGLARILWQLDGALEAMTTPSLQPAAILQSEHYRRKSKFIEIVFSQDAFTTLKWEGGPDDRPEESETVRQHGVHSLHSALLGIRSLPLRQGEHASLLVTPATTVYLLDLTVEGREPVTTRRGRRPAIRLDVRIRKLTKSGNLKPHSKLGKTTAWISDDSNRLPLRIEGDVFIGFVFAELTESATN